MQLRPWRRSSGAPYALENSSTESFKPVVSQPAHRPVVVPMHQPPGPSLSPSPDVSECSIIGLPFATGEAPEAAVRQLLSLLLPGMPLPQRLVVSSLGYTPGGRWKVLVCLPKPLALTLSVAKAALATISPTTSINIGRSWSAPRRGSHHGQRPPRPAHSVPSSTPRSFQPPRGVAAPSSRGAQPPAPATACNTSLASLYTSSSSSSSSSRAAQLHAASSLANLPPLPQPPAAPPTQAPQPPPAASPSACQPPPQLPPVVPRLQAPQPPLAAPSPAGQPPPQLPPAVPLCSRPRRLVWAPSWRASRLRSSRP